MKLESEDERNTLLREEPKSTPASDWKEFPDVPDLKANRRPYKGIFLTYLLMFAGLLFFCHGIHRYEEYTVWDLMATWILSGLLIIPGAFYGLIIIAIELKISGFSYKNHPELVY